MKRTSLRTCALGSLALGLLLLTSMPPVCLADDASKLAPTSERWEEAIQAFEAADKAEAPSQNGHLFIGSSSIRMWKTLAKDFPAHRVINRGFGGSQIVDSTYFASRIVIPYEPKKIYLYAGDNDMARKKSALTVLADFKRFVATVHQELPKTKIAFIAIKPSLSRWKLAEEMIEANQLVANYTKTDNRLDYIDIWTPMLNAQGRPEPSLFLSDGLHMNRKGYEIWVRAVKPYL